MELYICYNTFSRSAVTHGEANVTVVWEGMQAAYDHCRTLEAEYAVLYHDMPQDRRKWHYRQATVEEAIAAKEAGIIGTEWDQILGAGQAR